MATSFHCGILMAYRKNYPTHPGSHEDASYIHIEKTAPYPGGHVFPLIMTIFKLVRHINKTNVLTKFHDDWPKHVTFRVFTSFFRKTILTKCHEDWAKNVFSRLFTCSNFIHIEKTAPPPGGHISIKPMKNTPPPGGHVFLPIQTIFELNGKNVTSRVFTCLHYIHIDKTASPSGGHEKDPLPDGHVFLSIQTILELNRCIQETNVLTKFHEDWTQNVTSGVFTCFHYIHIEKTAPPSGGHFHDDWAQIVTSRVFTINTAPPPGGHLHEDWSSNVTSTVFIRTNILNWFHEDQTINVASRVFTRQNVDDARRTDDGQKVIPKAHHEHEKDPLPGGHVFLPIRTNFELNSCIKETNALTKLHKDWAKNVSYRLFTWFHYIHIEKTSPPTGGHFYIYKIDAKTVTSRVHVFFPIQTIFGLNRRIQQTNNLTKFHEELTKNVTSLVFTCFHYIHIKKTAPLPGGHFHDDQAKSVTSRVFTRNTAPSPGGHVFQWTKTIFILNQHIIKTNILPNVHKHDPVSNSVEVSLGTNVLTKFHEDRTINVASIVFKRQMLATHARRTTHDGRTAITLCSGELKR
ncbi:hypothetical protein DPMN_144465 [Dreissena polymorpha]|uniref:Uncharacterized protein n=1 Tax=Dreissena polymorpha TaxID=45954 RepID=A0A9D4GL52_DREPO|nr:hypothetical protein DPMN_144465 [Dreissena polymorpha]